MRGSAKVRRYEGAKVKRFGWMALAAAFACAALPSRGVAQLPLQPLALEHGAAGEGADRYRDPPVNVEGKYVVISLAEHRLYLMEESRVLWSSIVGTGTGTRLEGAGQRWEFSTPRDGSAHAAATAISPASARPRFRTPAPSYFRTFALPYSSSSRCSRRTRSSSFTWATSPPSMNTTAE